MSSDIYQGASGEMLGVHGSNRTHQVNGIGASNDQEAILAWLAHHTRSSETYRAYAREARRLVLWCLLIQHKPVSSLTSADMLQYQAFLTNPPDDLVGARAPQIDAQWKPFARNAMSATSVKRCMMALVSLFSFLERQKYIHLNPMSEFRNMPFRFDHNPSTTERYLDDEQIAAVKSVIDESRERWVVRTRYAVALQLFCGLRIEEVTTCAWNAIALKKDGTWRIGVNGKGAKYREVPVPPAMLNEIIRYRRFIDLPDLPTSNETERMLLKHKGTGTLQEREARNDVKALFALAAERISDPDKAALLRRASPHWIRHSYITRQATKVTVREMKDVQALAGHASFATTAGYVAPDADAQYELVKNDVWPNYRMERK